MERRTLRTKLPRSSNLLATLAILATFMVFLSPLSSNAQPKRSQNTKSKIAQESPNQQLIIAPQQRVNTDLSKIRDDNQERQTDQPLVKSHKDDLKTMKETKEKVIDKPKTEEEITHFPLYVFGDSLFDTGMALYAYKGPAADSYPYGNTYFKRPAGRFSDGRLIPDFIAQFANLPLLEPYKNPKLTDYTLSVNFADASSGVLEETRPGTLNLKLQTEYFNEMVQKMEQKLGKAQTKKVLAKAVYLYNTGANDYVDFYYQNPQPIPASVKSLFLNKILGNYTAHINEIYNQGGRKFAFLNFAPIGCFPTFLNGDGSCKVVLNNLARTHNIGFAGLLKRLTQQLPGFTYTIYDFYTALSIRLSHGYRYGFKEYKAACCGSGPFNGRFTCMDKENFTYCGDPTTYLWFDAGHPTQTADEQFAREFWNGSEDIVSPNNLKSFFELS